MIVGWFNTSGIQNRPDGRLDVQQILARGGSPRVSAGAALLKPQLQALADRLYFALQGLAIDDSATIGMPPMKHQTHYNQARFTQRLAPSPAINDFLEVTLCAQHTCRKTAAKQP